MATNVDLEMNGRRNQVQNQRQQEEKKQGQGQAQQQAQGQAQQPVLQSQRAQQQRLQQQQQNNNRNDNMVRVCRPRNNVNVANGNAASGSRNLNNSNGNLASGARNNVQSSRVNNVSNGNGIVNNNNQKRYYSEKDLIDRIKFLEQRISNLENTTNTKTKLSGLCLILRICVFFFFVLFWIFSFLFC